MLLPSGENARFGRSFGQVRDARQLPLSSHIIQSCGEPSRFETKASFLPSGEKTGPLSL